MGSQQPSWPSRQWPSRQNQLGGLFWVLVQHLSCWGVCNVALAALAAPTGGAALAAQAALNACSGFFILGAAALGAGGVIAQTGQQTAAISFNLSNTAGRWRIFALSLL